MTILICEQEEILLTAIEFRLQKNGFSVLRTNNTDQAVKHLEEDKPDMLICDLDMEGLNGIQLTQKLRNDMKSDMPIILLAELEDGEMLEGAFQAGANDFVTKPLSLIHI